MVKYYSDFYDCDVLMQTENYEKKRRKKATLYTVTMSTYGTTPHSICVIKQNEQKKSRLNSLRISVKIDRR